jgi:hypothetical protein
MLNMKAYVFSAGKNSNQEYGREQYHSKLLDYAKDTLESFGSSLLEDVSTMMCRQDGQFLVLATGMIGRSEEFDTRGRPFRVSVAWTCEDEYAAKSLFLAALHSFMRRVEIFDANMPGIGDEFADRVVANLSWDSASELGYTFDEKALVSIAREEGRVASTALVAPGVRVLTTQALEELIGELENSKLPLTPDAVSIAVVNEYVDRDLFEGRVYRGLAHGFNEKREASRMPGERRRFSTIFRPSVLVSVLASLALGSLGTIYLVTRDKTAPVLKEIAVGGEVISMKNPIAMIEAGREQSLEINIEWNEQIANIDPSKITVSDNLVVENIHIGGDGNELRFVIRLPEERELVSDGVSNIQIEGIADRSGNEAVPLTIVLDTAPVLQQITVNGETVSLQSPKVTIATASEQANEIRIRWNEQIAKGDPSLFILPDNFVVENVKTDGDGKELRFDIRMAEESNQVASGELVLQIKGVLDSAGNEAKPLSILLEQLTPDAEDRSD